MGSGVVVGIGTFFFTPHRIKGMSWADGRNGTDAGKFETVAGFCGDVGFAAGQPGCMSISKSSRFLPGTSASSLSPLTSSLPYLSLL
jgi:hypothetical protein